jgi:hypothetical protein
MVCGERLKTWCSTQSVALRRLNLWLKWDTLLNSIQQGIPRFLLFGVIGIWLRCFSRANRVALCFVKVAFALNAHIEVDHVKLVTFADRVDRAFSFACATGDAFVSDYVCHLFVSLDVIGGFDRITKANYTRFGMKMQTVF